MSLFARRPPGGGRAAAARASAPRSLRAAFQAVNPRIASWSRIAVSSWSQTRTVREYGRPPQQAASTWARIAAAARRASPRADETADARRTVRPSVAIAVRGASRAATVLSISASNACPGESGRGLHAACERYRVTAISAMGTGAVRGTASRSTRPSMRTAGSRPIAANREWQRVGVEPPFRIEHRELVRVVRGSRVRQGPDERRLARPAATREDDAAAVPRHRARVNEQPAFRTGRGQQLGVVLERVEQWREIRRREQQRPIASEAHKQRRAVSAVRARAQFVVHANIAAFGGCPSQPAEPRLGLPQGDAVIASKRERRAKRAVPQRQ